MSKSRSLVESITKRIWIEIILMLFLAVCLVLAMLHISDRDAKQNAEYLLSVYSQQLEDEWASIERTLSNVLEENSDIIQLSDDDETIRTYATIRIKSKLGAILRTDGNTQFIVIVDAHYDTTVAEGGNLPAEQMTLLINDTAEKAAQATGMAGAWRIINGADSIWICRSAVRRGLAIHLYTSPDTLLRMIQPDQRGNVLWQLLDHEGNVVYSNGSAIKSGGFFLQHDFQSAPFALTYTQSNQAAAYRLRLDALALILAAVFLWLFLLHMRRFIRRELSVPMKKLEDDMRAIQEGEYNLRIQSPSSSQEFIELTDTFNHLMDEIVHLKIQEYEKQMALQEADQKYIRLQLRPHFFLNAMTTVSALSAKEKNQEIQTYIEALSKNIRYMFSAGLHTVAVGDEIQHVQNYLKMQELKYPDCVFSYIDLPEELKDWPIPQMLIHTLVENEYKYAVSRETMLMLVIQVSQIEYKGETVLKIQVEDDGKGYPSDVLEAFKQQSAAQNEDGTRVGLASLKRLMSLMYERDDLFILSNREPHGAAATIYIPSKPVHER